MPIERLGSNRGRATWNSVEFLYWVLELTGIGSRETYHNGMGLAIGAATRSIELNLFFNNRLGGNK